MWFRSEEAAVNKFFNNRFGLGFSSGIFLFAVFNYISYILSEGQSTHTYDRFGFGFPFFVYDYKSYVAKEGINEVGLILTIMCSLFFSFLLGLIFKFVWSKTLSRRTELK
jgi:hypothetical protein